MGKRKYSLSIIARYFPLEFQISGDSWRFYELGSIIVPQTDNIKLPDFRMIRLIIKRMYEKKDLSIYAHQPLLAGDLNAIALINEIFRYIVTYYRLEIKQNAYTEGFAYVKDKISEKETDKTIDSFMDLFPPHITGVDKNKRSTYINETTNGYSNKDIVLKELILLNLANENPAFSNFIELFNDKEIKEACKYKIFFKSITDYFRLQPGLGANNKSLIDFLYEPILASPYSLEGQLIYIRQNWSFVLPEELITRIFTAIDVIKEEKKSGAFVKGQAPVLHFKGLEEFENEWEQFTKDKDWMSSVVVVAKSTYVWMDQLSKKYGRQINKLDQIPDEELDLLARWGFTGLWLIGLWERSSASRKIKQICGNPEALSSAYSVYDYTISYDLGGRDTFLNLKNRALRRGIIIASDIVPNHAGIYSKWVVEHPSWFVQLDHLPFPSYSFTGPDLSEDPRVGLYIEDGYWTKRDAAVVFKREDKWTGDVKYIYHGNDGTNMPWNDTAQLNFLNKEVRENVIQSILNVAKDFPIIRLDAAMTLTKKHFQRLWFPSPGTGGGIPSRAEHGMTKREFDKVMPNEFWREVVDRINREAPDTLLIAEAFWLMEGYFVRTLGMHRVYNSAFMNMLKTEDNANYRNVIKNVLEFNPEILRRFVNFMNNPDEETAVAQFGKGDKYYGVCLMMVTLPGLPMFGHGQIEGFSEKYGMEYRAAYWNEHTDLEMVRRHEYEIFPLMRKRQLFSGINHFLLYDFFTNEGYVNENVYAYSNMHEPERALVIYNNKYEKAAGWVKESCAFSIPAGEAGQRKTIRKSLAEGLHLSADEDVFYIFKDNGTGLQYIRNGRNLSNEGLHIELGAFHYHAFINFREVKDSPKCFYKILCDDLRGRGVPDIESALEQIIFKPVYTSFKSMLNRKRIEDFDRMKPSGNASEMESFTVSLENFILETKTFTGIGYDEKKISREAVRLLKSAVGVKSIDLVLGKNLKNAKNKKNIRYLKSMLDNSKDMWKIIMVWLVLSEMKHKTADGTVEKTGSTLIQKLKLNNPVYDFYYEINMDESASREDLLLLKILLSEAGKSLFGGMPGTALNELFNDHDSVNYLHVNIYEGVLWFSKEKFEKMIRLLYLTAVIAALKEAGDPAFIVHEVDMYNDLVSDIMKKSEKSGYKVDEMIKNAHEH